ncbi:MAG: OmpA family protein, partial [Rickettsiales bacterium]
LPEPDSKPDTATTASQPEVQQDAKGHKMLRLTFSETETDIPFAMQGAMNELVQHLNANPESRVEAVSYAGSADEQEVIAKRISLSRALAARAYFIDQGIDASRIDVKAKGNKESGGGPAERVDITIKETGEE